MSKINGKSTAPAVDSTVDPESSPPCLALVIAWSASQPHRVGEIAFFPFGERLLIGRGDVEVDKFAHFVRQRPGETAAVDPHEAVLAGDSISRRQLLVRCTGDALEIERIGRCPTYINGDTELTTAHLRPGETVLLKGELLLLCVLRPRVTPRPPPCVRGFHAFGEADADGIVGESPAAWALRAQLALAARTNDHVLIQGESGTGKELAAAAVHNQSTRAKRPFVPCNASAFTSSLLASELFGNPANYPNPGAPARPGLVREADRGTLFLDEIGDLSKDAQVQLLRVLDDGEFRAVGEATPRRVDIRLFGATNRDDSPFRGDFVARFSARVRVSPLRERREDIPLIIRHLLLERAGEYPELIERFFMKMPNGRLEPRLSAHLVDRLVRHPLPTNVRELRTILISAIDASQGDKLTLPPKAARPQSLLPVPSVPPLVNRVTGGAPSKEELEACLQRERWNVKRVAGVLNLSRGTLYRLMDSYGIEREKEPAE